MDNTASLKILYIGTLDKSGNCYRRFQTLQSMGHRVHGLDTDPFILGNIFTKFHFHLNVGPGIHRLKKAVWEAVQKQQPEIIWVDNKSYLQPGLLKKIRSKYPSTKIISLLTDDPVGRKWRLYLNTAPYFDVHFVQRRINIPELKARGAKRVEICYRSFDPLFHRPLLLSATEHERFDAEVGFVGTHESYREDWIVYLMDNGIKVWVTGNDWENARNWEKIKPFYKGRSVYGEDYIKTINGMDIALHFLRHVNRDEQDSRTFEIPACGAFMLGETSELHLDLFKNGEEAVFVNSKEEMLEKINYYLAHPEERKAIAAAGLERSINSGYDHRSRLTRVIEMIGS